MTTQPIRNPYKIGNPIFENEQEKFFGRQELFDFIKDHLNNNTKIILLYGQRRIGKSSVLRQIAHKIVLEGFVFICCDLQEHSKSSPNQVLYDLAQQIAEKLDSSEFISQEEFNNNLDIFSDDFLPKIYQTIGEKNLVLLLDEFDVVGSDENILNHPNNFSFSEYLQLLLKQHKRLFIIPVVGRTINDFKKLLTLFKDAPLKEVGLLDELSARKLITQPVQGNLEYDEHAITEILKLSSGHPCLIQFICFNLFIYVRLERRLTVTREDVEQILDNAIETAEGGIAWFYDGLSPEEKVLFSAVSDAQEIAIKQNKSSPENTFTHLENYGVIKTEELTQAAKKLVDKGYLDENKQRVKIELIRRWIVQYYPLNREILKLEEIKKEEINQISEKAKALYKQGKIQEEIDHYENILKLHPNHFSTIPILAESYLEIKNFDKALTLYKRAYQADPSRNKEGFLLVVEKYGEYLIKKGELSPAKIQFEAVLKIDYNRKSAKDKLREIEAVIEQQKLEMKPEEDKQKLKIYPFILLIILIIIAVTSGIIGIIIYQSLTSCPQGQQKLNDECVTTVPGLPVRNDPIQSNISSGDRTLFFTIPNSYRDQGIEAFKQGNYTQAIKLFQQAITANRSDAEVRIYYNNAIAREKGNPFTLAVVVPAENGQARSQEILRGVAQSQEQFNANGGRDGRSLEIVIANDGDNEKQAEQIAQYLANDKSVLGVIGHGSSTTTNAALNIYKKVGIPIISPTSSAHTLQGKNFFRTTPSDAAFGEKLAKYAIDPGLNKVVIVYNSKNNYSNSLREKFETNFTGQIISRIDLTDPTLNIEQELKDSASQKVRSIILLPNVEHIATALDIAKVNVNNKLGLKLLGGDALYNPKTLEDRGNAVEGLVLAVPWFREASQAKDFSQAAKQMWGGDISWRTATSYDAAQAFINSLSAQPSREAILQKLPQTNLSAKLTSGNNLKFQKGERQNEAVLVKVESGEFKCLKQCSP